MKQVSFIECFYVYAMLSGKVHQVLQPLALCLFLGVPLYELVALGVVKLADVARFFQRGALLFDEGIAVVNLAGQAGYLAVAFLDHRIAFPDRGVPSLCETGLLARLDAVGDAARVAVVVAYGLGQIAVLKA